MASSLTLPPAPPSLKPIQHYLKTANEHETRDPVITYWCRIAALQNGLNHDKKSKEALALLMPLMDWLEKEKKVLADNEAVTSEVVASAHVENYAMKLFTFADKEDRASNFNKNVVKAFYSAGILLDVMQVFGELTPENAQVRKYAKWKAAYIHNCLKNGEAPIPGPAASGDEFGDDMGGAPVGGQQDMGWAQPQIPTVNIQEPNGPPVPAPRGQPAYVPPTVPAAVPAAAASADVGAGAKLSSSDVAKVQKYCKYATSALDYDDADTAIANLEKALSLLKTGRDAS